MRFLTLLLVALLMPALIPGSASAQGVRFDRDACAPPFCDESGWIFDDSNTDHITSWRHSLGVVPRQISILFTPDPNGRRVMPVQWSWHDGNSGNPISVEMGRRAVRLHIHRSVPLHGIWNIDTQRWTQFREGYWKVIVYR